MQLNNEEYEGKESTMRIEKTFKSAYVLDEAKLRRMLDVLDQAFSESKSKYNIQFKTNHPQQKVTTVNTAEDLLSLDNSKKYPIESLQITAVEEPANNTHSVKRYSNISFKSYDKLAEIDYEIYSTDSKWTNNFNALLVEQIERTFQKSWFSKISLKSPFEFLIIFISFALLIAMPFLISMDSKVKSSQQMWLTDNNLAQISKSEKPIDPTEVLNMQIKNIHDFNTNSKSKWLKDWRFYAAILPLIIVLACFAYLLLRCYPKTVFNWGDMGEHYETLLGQRKMLWSAIIFGVFVGLLANLAVYGLVDLTKS